MSAQHYNFAARVFARVVRDMGGEKYSMAFRETPTYEVSEDVGLMRSEVGVLLMTEQNGEVLRSFEKPTILPSITAVSAALSSGR